MIERVTVQQIADALGIQKRPAEMRAKRNQWPYIEEAAKGGKRRLYDADALPENVRQALRAADAEAKAAERAKAAEQQSREERLADLQASGEAFAEQLKGEDEAAFKDRLKRRERAAAEFAALPDGDKKRNAKAREFILLHAQQYIRDHGLGKTAGIKLFCDAVKCGELPLPEWVRPVLPTRHGVQTMDKATFYRWQQKWHELGRMGLVDSYGNRRGQSKIEQTPELKKVVLGALMKYPHITAKKIKQFLSAEHPALDILSIKSIERYINGWKEENAQLWTFMVNPDKWKNVYMSAAGSHQERIVRLNQVWELDSTPGDWMLTDGRHSVLGVIDLFSRRLKLYVSKTSKAMAVCQVFRRSALDWGICEAVRTDNGKDYVAEQFDGVLRDLDVGHEVCLPFASEEKGSIERAFRTMSHGLLDLLPGFIGHNVAERKVIEARKSFAQRIMTPGETVEVSLSAAELQAQLDQWVDHVYMRDAHSGEGMNGMSPFEKAASWTGGIRRISDERAMDLLLAEVAGTRTITKKGVRFEHRHYFDKRMFEYVGQEALLKYDEQDLGRLAVYVDGEFICWAVNHELTGTSRQEAAVASKSHQKKFLAAQAADYRRYKRDLKTDLPSAVLRHRIEQSKNVTAYPHRVTDHHSDGLSQAAKAAGSMNRTNADSKTANAARELAAERMSRPAEIHQMQQTPKQRYESWCSVDEKITAGEPVSEKDRKFHTNYQSSVEFRSMQRVAALRA